MTFTLWLGLVPREQIIRLLLKIIPSERGYKLHEDSPDYNIGIDINELLENVPMPPGDS
jgi:hypothetical protein